MSKFYKIILVLTAFCIPVFFSTLTNNNFTLNKILLLNFFLFAAYLGWFIESIKDKTTKVNFNFLAIILILYVLDAALSSIFSISPYLSQSGFLTIVSLFCLFYFVSNKFQPEDIDLFVKSLFASGLIVSIYAFFQFFGMDFIGWEPKEIISIRPIGTFGNPIFLSNFMAVIACGAVFYYLKSKKYINSVLYLICFSLFYPVIYITFTRSGWAAFCVPVLLLIFLKKEWLYLKKTKFLILLLLVIILPLFIHALPVSRKADKLAKEKFVSAAVLKDVNISARFYLWENAVNVILDSPFTGHGLNTFSYSYTKYRYSEPMEIRGELKRPDNVHNQLLEHGISGGLPFLILFALTIYCYFKYSMAIHKLNGDKNISIILILLGISYLIGILFVFSSITLDVIWFILLAFCSLAYSKINETKPKLQTRIIIAVLFLICAFNFYNISKAVLADYYYKKALTQAAGNYKTALMYIDKSISTNPENPEYIREKARMLEGGFLSGKAYYFYQKSRLTYYDALKLKFTDPYLWANLARLNMEAGNHKEAVKCYLQALFLDPYNAVFLNDLGTELYYVGNKKLAYQYYLDSCRIYPYSPVVNTNLALIFMDKGEYIEAERYINTALKIDKNFMPAKELLKEIKGKNK